MLTLPSGQKILRPLCGATISNVGLLLLARAEEIVPRVVKERPTTIVDAPGAVRGGRLIVIPEGGAGVRSLVGIGIGIGMIKGEGVQARVPGLRPGDPVRSPKNPRTGTETETGLRLPLMTIEQKLGDFLRLCLSTNPVCLASRFILNLSRLHLF